jgi:NADH-quinone oxidoreductase subunit F
MSGAATGQEGGRIVSICRGTGCESARSGEIQQSLEQEIERLGIPDVTVKFTGCHGFCEHGPIVVIEPDGIFYTKVTVEDAPLIIEKHLRDGEVLERLLYRDPATDEPVPNYEEIPFYARQTRLVLKQCGHIDPESLEEYLADRGYEAARKALFDMTPEDVIEEVKGAGLRGRGGAGFPAGVKWGFCRREEATPKYLIGNADEGDPGAFMNRSLLEGNPHLVVEGMVIAAYAIGASEGYVYCRAEYPLAIHRMRVAMQQALENGYLGENIMGSGFSFDLHLKEGAGAFVCGEETALMASIEGRRGMPNPRPPFPAQSGLWGKPTNINNVETLANVPLIILNGADWYAGYGTERSKGTKTFALTGKITNTGLIEVPLGIPLSEIVYDIGGGPLGGKKFKALQIGGPSGGCIPDSLLSLPVEYESLAEVGAIIGSGGIVIMDEDTCMVDVARFFLDFTQSESCGKCVPCRVGTKRMLEILERICAGKGEEGDIETLVDLAETVKAGSLCGLGQTAPNPVLSTIKYFRDEYEAHIRDRVCPAGACKDLVHYYIIEDKCTGCTLCSRNCPQDAISGERKQPHLIDQALCIQCGVCYEKCRFGAIEVR